MSRRSRAADIGRQLQTRITQLTLLQSKPWASLHCQRRCHFLFDITSPCLNSRSSSNGTSSSSGGGSASSITTGYTWVWNETENWCSLCREPLNSWNEHRGKRDHICLEMFYNALVHYGRQWTPATLWWEVEECTLFRRSSVVASSCLIPETTEEPVLDFVHAPTSGKCNLSALMKYYDRSEHYRRRLELYACVRHLIDAGIVRIDRAALGGGASFHGSLVGFKELFPNLVNMFPYADAKEISALTQMIASTYNSETVFDLCNFRMLVSAGHGQEALGSKSGVVASPQMQPPSGGEQQGTLAADAATGMEEYSYHWKGLFCRGVMGQLRWALEPDSVVCPLQTGGGGGGEEGGKFCDQYWQVLAEHTCRALLAEMVFCRISEYVVRVEGVWRQRGQEMARRTNATIGGRSGDEALQQLASNWGMVKYMDDHFYDASFGSRLPNDGMPKRKRIQLK